MINYEEAMRALFSECENNEAAWDRMLTNPDMVLAQIGVAIPSESAIEFRDFLLAAKKNNQLPTTNNFPSAKCTACTISVWSFAAVIVAGGAAFAATLTASSAIVLALASWAGVSVMAALAFIKSLTFSLGAGVAHVAKQICKWAGICP